MKASRLIILLFLSLTFLFVGCEKSTEPEEKPEEAFEKSAVSMNLTMANMLNSQMYFALIQMPQGLVGLPDVILPISERNQLQKSISTKSMITADSSFIHLFEGLEALYGTHTYDGTQWIHSESPTNEVIINYPFVNVNNNTNHQMSIRIYGIIKSETLLQLSMEGKIDNIRKLY